jgi:hypothetical protein
MTEDPRLRNARGDASLAAWRQCSIRAWQVATRTCEHDVQRHARVRDARAAGDEIAVKRARMARRDRQRRGALASRSAHIGMVSAFNVSEAARIAADLA